MSADPAELFHPPCQVREHPRARHVRLRVDPREGLIVTVPPHFDRRRLAAVLAQRADWIEAVQERQAMLRQAADPKCLGMRPQRIGLAAVGRVWTVDYQFTRRRRMALEEHPERLVLLLPQLASDELDRMVAAYLKQWLLRCGRRWLSPWVAQLAKQHGFAYRSAQIRNQSSRWGSCSARGVLSLNARLLFCEPATCEYVLIHELTHTVHPDHSPVFWARVAETVPDHRRHQAALKEVWLRLPDWV